jgi:hypothetical protein
MALLPPADGDPIEVLRWVRRFEIIAAVFAVAVAIAEWDTDWLRWTMLGLALLSLSPWPGAATIIRRRERTGRPTTTLSPEARRTRARRATWATMAYILVGSFVLATILAGPGAGLIVAIIALACSIPGVLLARRWTRGQS